MTVSLKHKWLHIVFCFLLTLSLLSFNAVSQISENFYTEEAEEDTIPLIIEYEKFNKILGGDSLRMCDQHLCMGWIRDFHPNEALKHRGFYVDGQLQSVYKNYYENGQLEREFSVKNHRKSIMKIYYPDGTPLSEIEYDYTSPIFWTDYYPNGNIEYTEKMHKRKDFIIFRKFYTPDGTPESITELSNAKRSLFNRTEYFDNGQIKAKGQLTFNPSLRDYQRTGIWRFFDENGNLLLEETYYKNRVIDDSEYIEEEEYEED